MPTDLHLVVAEEGEEDEEARRPFISYGCEETLSQSYENGFGHYDLPNLESSFRNDKNIEGNGGMGGIDPVTGHPYHHLLPHHHRVNSWSGGVSSAPPYYPSSAMMAEYAASFHQEGSDFLHNSAPALFPPQQQQQQLPPSHPSWGSRRKRKNGNHHRRVHSDNVMSSMSYGSIPPSTSFEQRGGGGSRRGGGATTDFSPKTEFMKITESFRSVSPARDRKNRHHHRSMSPTNPPWSTMVAPPSPQTSFRGTTNGMPNYSPIPYGVPVASHSTTRIYGMNGEGMAPAGYGTASRGGGGSSHNNGGGNDPGGEAIFAAQKRGTRHKRTQSSRRMHMRQKSAQLYMEDIKGQEQTPSCRDIIFLFLFVFHLLGIIYLGNTYGYETVRFRQGTEEMDDSPFTIIYENLVFLSLLSGVFGMLVSGIMLLLMIAVAKRIVQIALFVSIGLSFVWGTMGIGLSPHKVVPATGIIALALTVAYTIVVWERCKFHGSNLYASLTGIRANAGAVIIALCFQLLALFWSIYFTYVAVGVYDAIVSGQIEMPSQSTKTWIFVGLGVSYCWTLQVFLNIVHVTVAGVIGSWWFTPDGDTSKCGEDLRRSFFRSIFYSIGSICFGSLIIGPVRLLRQLSALFRPSDDHNSLLCFHECIKCIQTCLTSCVDNLADRYNSFSLTYVGLYGYGLADGGFHSTELFAKRGWTVIVSDDLVPNVLLMTCLVIAGATGCFAHVLDNVESLTLTSLNEPLLVSFIAGSLIGFVVSSVLFAIISSSVHAVLVCFAASPLDFHTNHPELSAEMRSAWREVWPGCMDVVDGRMLVGNYLDNQIAQAGQERQFLIP